MKRSIFNEYNQLHEKLTGYVAKLNFRYLNLCIKAEPVSLIPVKVNVEGEMRNLEQVAYTAKKDDYRFWIVPKFHDDLTAIAEGVAKVHPEFRQEVGEYKSEGLSGEGSEHTVKYLQLTMPEVDDNLYDAMKDAVDVFYQECKTLSDAALTKAKGAIALQSAGEPKDDIDDMKKAIDDLQKKNEEHRDQLRDKKLKDIEEAYHKWLERVGI